jgi:phosphatidyl-myo-inositol dimannoside synthase
VVRRTWSKLLPQLTLPKNGYVIALLTDAFGGRGGIALYNRSFLRALCSYPGVREVLGIPRSIVYAMEPMPAKLRYVTSAARGLPSFAWSVFKALGGPRPDLVVCGHLHLLPFAFLLRLRFGCPVLPLTYGIEAWTPTSHRLANHLAGKLQVFASIRRMTARRLIQWSQMQPRTFFYLPNCVDLAAFGIAPRRHDLVERHGLAGRTVIVTMGRMDSASVELRKGFDEVLEALPALVETHPTLKYLVVGDGDDRPRLEQKARDLGVADQVVFVGYVREADKADYYRLADVFAQPGSNPAFDRYPFRFTYLEALACGVPVVGARFDDPEERVDPDACALITQVDPTDTNDIVRGIRACLEVRKNGINPVLSNYSYEQFQARVWGAISDVLSL